MNESKNIYEHSELKCTPWDQQQEWQFHSSVSLGMEERPTQRM